jgi:flagellar motility protein MotE (MotC chaperone)
MIRPFPLVIVAALGLIGVKVASFMMNEPQQYDTLVTGSLGNRTSKLQPLPSKPQDDVFIRALSSLPPKEAARVFSGLEAETQAEIAPRLSSTLFGDILSQMPPEKAEKLAVLLAGQREKK